MFPKQLSATRNKKSSRKDKEMMFINFCLWNVLFNRGIYFHNLAKKDFLSGIYFSDEFPQEKKLQNLSMQLDRKRKNYGFLFCDSCAKSQK